MKKQLFITGVSGFVGRRLAEIALKSGFSVVGIDKVPLEMPGVNFYQVDPLEKPIAELIPKGSAVVHLASLSTDSLCKENPELALKLNLNLTLKVLIDSKLASVNRFIFASSEWVYPEKQDTALQYETDKLDLNALSSLYALTKIFGESIIRTCASVSHTILRFGIVYGPRSLPGSAAESISLKAARGEDINVGAAATARRFIFIDDLVDAIIATALADDERVNEKIINVAGPELVSLGKIVEVVTSLMDSKPNLVDKGGKASIRNPDISRAESLLDWKPTHNFQAGITKCINLMQKQ